MPDASFDARRKMSLVPDTTSELHATAGNGPYFLAGAQTQILGPGGGRSLRTDILVEHASAR
jgi:hypothetical protein